MDPIKHMGFHILCHIILPLYRFMARLIWLVLPVLHICTYVYIWILLTMWDFGDVSVSLRVWFSNSSHRILSWAFAVKLLPYEYYTDLTDEKTTLAQVMPSCHQVTSHYPNMRWPRSMSPYGVTRPQCLNNQLDLPNLWQTELDDILVQKRIWISGNSILAFADYKLYEDFFRVNHYSSYD